MSTISFRDGHPVVCVKDHTIWARDPRTADMIADLQQCVVDAVYEGVRDDFWSDVAPDIAREYGYSGELSSLGRSGGWLALDDPLNWPDYVVDGGGGDSGIDLPDLDERREAGTCSGCLARVYRGEECVCEDGGDAEDTESKFDDLQSAHGERDQWVKFASAISGAVAAAGEMFVQRLREAYDDLQVAREDCIVRSVN